MDYHAYVKEVGDVLGKTFEVKQMEYGQAGCGRVLQDGVQGSESGGGGYQESRGAREDVALL